MTQAPLVLGPTNENALDDAGNTSFTLAALRCIGLAQWQALGEFVVGLGEVPEPVLAEAPVVETTKGHADTDARHLIRPSAALPMVRKICVLVSSNRLRLSSLMGLEPERVEAHVWEAWEPECEEGVCEAR